MNYAGAFVAKLIPLLRKQWPNPRCEVNHANPLELMVGVILSAQSTDKRVNELTRALFKKYRTPQDYVDVGPAELERDIRPAGFFRSKTKSIQGACQVLVEQFGGKMPKTMEDLLELPGIGRKSANVILGAAFGIASGIVVDTHMIRLANRFQLSKSEDPVKIEEDLTAVVPKKDWIYFSQAMVLHGRYICVARKPRCFECQMVKICPFSDKVFEPPNGEEPTERKTITGVPINLRS
ncbi:MAG: endonuclease III [Elusimicrobia bacterium RIFCSPLOWO2_01_FULL_59_12]|nr:MAG: endonuclease III [Elusimicrobia bacterium RIFCSPLOWO2_01_FULL_59_12]